MGTATFPSGTKTVFQQTTAPTGWTKVTTFNNCALRTVTGAASSGGTQGFSSVHANTPFSASVSYREPNNAPVTDTGSTTISTVGNHPHPGTVFGSATQPIGPLASPFNWYRNIAPFPFTIWNVSVTTYTTSVFPGGGGSHNHPFSVSGSVAGNSADFSIKYVDCIIAQID